MRKTFSLLTAGAMVLLLSPTVAFGGATATTHKWKFSPTINAPWALEDDEDALDTKTEAAGLCRSNPFNTTGAYGPLGSNVNVIVGDAVNSSGFSNFGCTTPQNETTIAVNPTNPNNLIVGANDYRVCCDFEGLNDGTGWAYYSMDGGATWANVQLPKLTAETGGSGVFKRFDSAGDPVVTFSPDGVAYYANIVFSRVTPASGVVVSVSRDGGRTWSSPNMVSDVSSANFFLDKEWIAAGRNGQVAVTWTHFNQGPRGSTYLSSPIVGATSNDYGKTWNRQGFPVSDAAHPFNQGSQVAFDRDGALYVAYEGASPATGYATDALVLARSTDNGRTFQTVELARVYDDFDCYPIYDGSQTLSDMHFRINSYPSMSIDPVSSAIAIVWTDNQGSGSCGTGASSFSGTTANRVKLVTGTWPAIASAGTTALTASPSDTVFPSVAAANGNIAVSYYTRDYAVASSAAICHLRTNSDPALIDPETSVNSVCMDYAGRFKVGSGPFGAQRRLSTESSNPFIQFANGSFIGDYSQVAIAPLGNKAYAAWTDFRGKPGTTPANQDVLVQSFVP